MPREVREGWFSRGCARLARALDPAASLDREETRAVLRALKDLRDTHGSAAAEESRQLEALRSSVRALTREAKSTRRDLGRVRHDVSRDRDRLSQLLRVAGVAQRGVDAEQRAIERLARLARSPLPIIVGPWTGEVGFELLYWIPFLQRVRQTFPIDPERLVAVSRGGVRDWYGHVTPQYEEIFGLVTPSRFREAIEERKKQRRIGRLERDLVRLVMRRRGMRRAHLLHPTLMYALFAPFWRYDTSIKRLESFARFRPLGSSEDPALAPVLSQLPSDFVAVRFYFSQCFPDSADNRAFAARVVEALAAKSDVVLLNNDLVVDDHRDFAPLASARVHALAAHMPPERNLAVQTAVIRRARAFVGTYGGYSYLAPLYGVHSVAFHSHATFQRTHLELAQRVCQRIGRARLTSLEVGEAHMLTTALAGVPAAHAVS